MAHKFDPKMLDRLRSPERREREPVDLIWEKLALQNPSIVIDIGAGIGYASIPFSRKMPNGVIYACDISDEMLLELEKEIEKEGVVNVKPIKMGEVDVPLRDGMADCVILQNLYHEFVDPLSNLEECRRLLRPHGKLALIDWKKEETPAGPPLEHRVSAAKIEDDLKKTRYSSITTVDVLPYHSFFIAIK